MGSVGPLDKATFGWLFVVPIWAASPAAAAYAWRSLDSTVRHRAAIAGGVAVGGSAGFLLWLDAVTADCQTGLARTPLELAVPAVVCGIATGAVYAFGLAEASGRAAAREPVRSVVVGAAAQLGLILIVPTIAFAAFFGVCARPR